VPWERRILVGILALAAAFRLSGVDLGWFLFDQARDALAALEIAEGKSLPLVGPVAQGLYALGPLYYYLIALPLWFSKDPSASVFFISLLNLTSVYLAYRLGQEFFGPTVGLVGAALYAVFPTAVISSHALWNPGLVPCFTVVFFYCLYHFLVRQRPWGLVGAMVALGCLLQVHLSGLTLLLVLALAASLYRPSFPWIHALTGCVLLLFLFSSYVVFEAKRDFQAFPDALRFFRQQGKVTVDEAQLDMVWEALKVPFTISTEMGKSLYEGVSRVFFKSVLRVELALFLGGLLWLPIVSLRQWQRTRELPRNYALLILWIVVPILALTQKREALFWYYFDLLYPAQFLVIGVVVDETLQAIGRWGFSTPLKRASYSLVALVVGLMVFSHATFVSSLHRDVIKTGTLRLPTAINLRFPEPNWAIREPGSIEFMALRYKRDLTAAILAKFPMDEVTFLQNVHGSAFEDILEDKGFFFQVFARQGATTHDEAHLAVVREQDWSGGGEGTFGNIGPFWLLKYRPAVRYTSWQYTREPRPQWFTPGEDGSSWTPVRLPARVIPDRSKYVQTHLFYWGTFPMYYRGWI